MNQVILGVTISVLSSIITASVLSIPSLEIFDIGVPHGAVIAVDSDKCPDKWIEMTSLAGQVIVGAGKSKAGKDYPFGTSGGAEQIVLTIEQIPPHSHDVKFWSRSLGGDGYTNIGGLGSDRDKTETGISGGINGKAAPVDIMPPYLALRFCKKR